MLYRDDDDVIYLSPDQWRRLTMATVLEEAGYHVQVCATVRELLRVAARSITSPESPLAGVLLIDSKLDEALGAAEVIAALRRAGIWVRTIVLAGFRAEDDVISCLRVGAADYIHVPAEPAEVLEVVGRVMSLPTIR